jgi:hypothetical protein
LKRSKKTEENKGKEMPKHRNLQAIAHLLKQMDPRILENMEKEYKGHPCFEAAVEQLKKDIEEIKSEKQ